MDKLLEKYHQFESENIQYNEACKEFCQNAINAYTEYVNSGNFIFCGKSYSVEIHPMFKGAKYVQIIIPASYFNLSFCKVFKFDLCWNFSTSNLFKYGGCYLREKGPVKDPAHIILNLSAKTKEDINRLIEVLQHEIRHAHFFFKNSSKKFDILNHVNNTAKIKAIKNLSFLLNQISVNDKEFSTINRTFKKHIFYGLNLTEVESFLTSAYLNIKNMLEFEDALILFALFEYDKSHINLGLSKKRIQLIDTECYVRAKRDICNTFDILKTKTNDNPELSKNLINTIIMLVKCFNPKIKIVEKTFDGIKESYSRYINKLLNIEKNMFLNTYEKEINFCNFVKDLVYKNKDFIFGKNVSIYLEKYYSFIYKNTDDYMFKNIDEPNNYCCVILSDAYKNNLFDIDENAQKILIKWDSLLGHVPELLKYMIITFFQSNKNNLEFNDKFKKEFENYFNKIKQKYEKYSKNLNSYIELCTQLNKLLEQFYDLNKAYINNYMYGLKKYKFNKILHDFICEKAHIDSNDFIFTAWFASRELNLNKAKETYKIIEEYCKNFKKKNAK